MVVLVTSLSYLMMSLFTGMPGMSWITTYRPGVHHFTFMKKNLFALIRSYRIYINHAIGLFQETGAGGGAAGSCCVLREAPWRRQLYPAD